MDNVVKLRGRRGRKTPDDPAGDLVGDLAASDPREPRARFYNWSMNGADGGTFDVHAVSVDGDESIDDDYESIDGDELGEVFLTHTDEDGKSTHTILDFEEAQKFAYALIQAARHSIGWQFCASCKLHVPPDYLGPAGIKGEKPTDLWCQECRGVVECEICDEEMPAGTGESWLFGWTCKACLDEEARERAACQHQWEPDLFDDLSRECIFCGMSMPVEKGDAAFPFVCDGWVDPPEA